MGGAWALWRSWPLRCSGCACSALSGGGWRAVCGGGMAVFVAGGHFWSAGSLGVLLSMELDD